MFPLPQSLLMTTFRLIGFPAVWRANSTWGKVLGVVFQASGARVPTLGRPVDVERADDAVTITPRGGHDRTIVFHHGGGFVFGASMFHWDFAIRLAVETRSRVVASLYPLLPDHDVTTILPAARRVHHRAVETDTTGRVIVMGDSAGAGLALASAQLDRDEGRPAAERLVLISPWLDVATVSEKARRIDHRDPLLTVDGLFGRGAAYRGRGVVEWHASPLRGDLTGLPPMMVLTGGKDLLQSNGAELAELGAAVGASIDLHDDAGLMHDAVVFGVRESARQYRALVETLTAPVAVSEPVAARNAA